MQQVLLTESAWAQPALWDLAQQAERVLVVPELLFKELSSLESPASIGALIERPQAASLCSDMPTVILDRLQDAGNVGSILRSAAAFGVTQVLALSGTAALCVATCRAEGASQRDDVRQVRFKCSLLRRRPKKLRVALAEQQRLHGDDGQLGFAHVKAV